MMDFEDEYLFLSKDLPNKSYAFFEDKRNEFCDIKLQVGEQSISAHRIILSAVIPYFYKTFSDKDVLESQEKVMTFPDVDPDSLESLIEFAYTRRVKINTGNVKTLLTAACLLQVDGVRDACCRFLGTRLNFQNVLNIRDYSSKLNCTELLEIVDIYIRENFEEISGTPDFLNIPFDFLIELTGRDDLKIKSEETLFEIVMKWVKQCPRGRQAKLPDLLRNVRLPLVKPSYVKNCIRNEELIRTSMECRDLLEEAMYYHFMPEEREKACSFSTRPRRFISSNSNTETNDAACIYVMHSEVKHKVESLDLEKGKWQTPVNREFVLDYKDTVAELNNKMYCFLPHLTYIYDLEKGNFSFCRGMTLPRDWAGSVAHRKKLYVFGGCVSGVNSNGQSDAVERFDPIAEEWTMLRNMNMRRSGPAVVASTKFIYILGGRENDSSIHETAEKFSISTGIWTMIPPMLTKRCVPGCAMLNDKIYVCGGLSDNIISNAEVFDTVTEEWKRISSLNTARKRCKLLSCRGKLYALGGVKDGKNLDTVEIYEPEEDKWKCGNFMNRKIIVVSAAALSPHLGQ